MEQEKKLRAVIFDMDGVIVDSEPVQEEATRIVLSQFGITYTEGDKLACRGMRDVEELEHHKKTHSLYTTLGEYSRRRVDAIRQLSGNIKLFDGFEKLVYELLKEKVRLAISTSSVREIYDIVHERFKILDNIELAVTGNELTNGKPHPEPYTTTIDRLRLQPNQCIAIEDSQNGIISIRAAGIYAIGVTTNTPKEMLEGAGASLVVASLSELNYDVLRKLVEQ